MKRVFTIGIIFSIFIATNCIAYNRSAAISYASGFWNTDLNNNGNVDNINYPPYLFYYTGGTTNGRDDSVSKYANEGARDCANFVSQCLISGGLVLNGGGQGGTHINTTSLVSYLSRVSEVTTCTSLSQVPSNITAGDVIIFPGHAVFIDGGTGSGVAYSAHSNDWSNKSLTDVFPGYWNTATFYHIDRIPPNITNVDVQPDPTDTNPALTATATDDSNVVEAEYHLNNPSPTAGTGNSLSVSQSGQDWAISGIINIAGLNDGQHSVYVLAKDAANNWSQPAMRSFTIRQDEVTVEDEDGNIILNGCRTDSDRINVTAAFAEGIDEIEVVDDEGNIIYSDDANYASPHTYSIGGLPEDGMLLIKVWDCLRNLLTFIIYLGDTEWPGNLFSDYPFSMSWLTYYIPHDPNAKTGPEGYVYPGEEVEYIIEFENEGKGIAYGVYITDILDEDIDDSCLVVNDFIRIDENKNETSADFEYLYNPDTRMLTVYIDNEGEILSKHGGKFSLRARVRSDASEGTVITNYATVYFPSAPEETRTNAVVSVVPYSSQLSYTGDLKIDYSDTVKLTAQLTTTGSKVSDREIEFKICESSWTAITDNEGKANVTFPVDILPGNYSVNVKFYGDGYYYLPSETSASIEILKEDIILSNPSAVLKYPSIGSLYIEMLDNDGNQILHQEDEPKELHLEYYDRGEWNLLGSSTLTDGKADFTFSLSEKPTQLNLSLKVRFDGDSRCNSGYSIGTLTIIDKKPPEISITSPCSGDVYIAKKNTIKIDYKVTDDLDPLPAHSAYLKHIDTDTIVYVEPEEEIEPLDINDGMWELIVEATDWTGNYSSLTSGVFQVIHDIQPPRTSIVISTPKYVVDTSTYITSNTEINLAAVDDLIEIGDSIGLGVEETRWKIEDGSGKWKEYTEAITISTEGINVLNYYSVDVIKNIESTHTIKLKVDNTLPESTLLTGTPKYEKDGDIYVSSSTEFTLTTVDPVVEEVASGVEYARYRIDSGLWTEIESPIMDFVLPEVLEEEMRTIYYYGVDNVGNDEIIKSTIVIVDVTPPETILSIVGVKYENEGKTYINAKSLIRLTAQDILSNDIMSGLKYTEYRINGGTWVVYHAEQALPIQEGIHAIEYRSYDNVENTENIKSFTVHVDDTPSVTLCKVEGVMWKDDDKTYINTDTKIVFEAIDYEFNEVCSGVREILYAVDDSSFTVYRTTFTLSEGIHTVKYYSIDNVENEESVKQKIFYVDNTPPVTEIVFGNPKFSVFGENYISPSTLISFKSDDPIANNVVSGVKYIEYSIDEEEYIVYTDSFTVIEGTHTIKYYAMDNVENNEEIKTYYVRVNIIGDYALTGVEEIKIDDKAEVRGDIRSNGKIKIKGKTRVEGDVYGDEVEIKGKSEVTGEVIEGAEQINPVPVDMDSISEYVIENNDNEKIQKTAKEKDVLDKKLKFKIGDKDSITLSAGTYYFTEIDITGQAVVNINGNVNILCTGKIEVSGKSRLNPEGDVYNLVIFVDKKKPKKGEQVKVDGNSEMRAIVYAPYSEVKIGGKSRVKGSYFALSGHINGEAKLEMPGRESYQPPMASACAGISRAGTNEEFKLGEVYSFPNPAKRCNPTIHIECGVADKVEIKIYNIAAELVKAVEITKAPEVIKEKYAYEYTWDIRGIASGVYVYVVQATKEGEKEIKVIKKLAIIK